MRILVVNPNTTASMTAKIGAAARAVAGADTTILAENPSRGPASIEGYVDEGYAVPGMLDLIRRADRDGVDAHVIACFDDTGLDAARALADAPVIGIGEAAFHMASLIAGRFSVVTTLSRSIPAIEHNLVRYGLASRCSRVRAAEVPVLALEDPQSDATRLIAAEIERAKQEDRADAIVLGCAGMADLAERLSIAHDRPVLDGVACAVKLAESLVTLNLRTAKSGGYVRPFAKEYGSPG